ncbi:hypothetical protein AcV5_006260 [Taiwanofungus camphoratus]|nr:hypothetical protein AcV5_006260 [Antrodia cinnamomea]
MAYWVLDECIGIREEGVDKSVNLTVCGHIQTQESALQNTELFHEPRSKSQFQLGILYAPERAWQRSVRLGYRRGNALFVGSTIFLRCFSQAASISP